MAPVYAFFPASLEGAVHVALVVLALCDAMMVSILGRLARQMTGGSHAPLLIAAAWCLNAFIIRITLGGLETSLSCFLAVLALSALHRARTSPARGSIVRLGILIGLAILVFCS